MHRDRLGTSAITRGLPGENYAGERHHTVSQSTRGLPAFLAQRGGHESKKEGGLSPAPTNKLSSRRDRRRSARGALTTRPPQGQRGDALRNETELERCDRNLNELLGELRVALPGVQVLFAFLLVAPFNQRFGAVNQFERDLYLATLLLTLAAATLLVAPTIVHRLHFQLGEKPCVVHTANRLMIARLFVFALAMTCAVLLVTHYLFDTATSVVTTGLVVAGFVLVWFALPMRNRHRANGQLRAVPERGADRSAC
jgi:uncharacterized protein DUF6328